MSDTEMLTPPPPEPTTDAEQKQAVFNEAVTWLYENFALIATGEQRGSGRIAPIRTRTDTSTVIPAFKTMMLPYRIEVVGPNGGITKLSPVDTWLTVPGRVEVAGFRAQPDKDWPIFEENGKSYINLYLRPELPEDGDARLGHEFLETLLPDERERTWYKQRLCYKLRHPAVPGPSVVHVAQDEFGVGRGTWFKILMALFGHWYVARPEFSDVIGTGGQAVYNEWMATSLLALVNETSHEEDHRYTIKQKAYERIKELVDTSRQVRRIKGKWEKLYDTECGPGFEFASNHNTPLAIADKDRRLTFLMNGAAQPPEFYVKVDAWRAVPGNLGAFRRDLEVVDLTGFNAYAPLPTTLRDIAMEDSRSVVDEAVDRALEVLPGEIMMLAQVVEAIEVLRVRQGLLPARRLAGAGGAGGEKAGPPDRRQGRHQLAAVPAAEGPSRRRLCAHGRGAGALDGRRPRAGAGRAAEE